MHSRARTSVSAKDFCRKLSAQFQGGEQQDTTEFGLYLLERMNEELSKIDTGIIRDLFSVFMQRTFECKNCHQTSTIKEELRFLILPVVREQSVQTILHQSLKPTPLSEGNMRECEICRGRQPALEHPSITSTSKYLVISLSRFRPSHRYGILEKNVDFVDIPQDMYVPVSTYSGVVYVRYSLYGCIIHSGSSTHQGHYVSIARSSDYSPNTPRRWFQFDDERTEEISLDAVKTNFNRSSQQNYNVPYVLFYEKLSG